MLHAASDSTRYRSLTANPWLQSRYITSRAKVLPGDELRANGQLVPRQAKSLTGRRLIDSGNLEHDAAGLDHNNPVRQGRLATTHARLSWLGGHRMIWEDAHPQLAT